VALLVDDSEVGAVREGNRKACAKDKQRTSARARHPKEGLITIVVVVSSKPVVG
jgi:hypothetical protein